MSTSDIVVKMDDRGRLTLAKQIRRNGIEPASHWHLSFGPDQTVILSPVTKKESIA